MPVSGRADGTDNPLVTHEGTELDSAELFVPGAFLTRLYRLAEMHQSRALPHNQFPVDTHYESYPTKAELLRVWLSTVDIDAMNAQPAKTDFLFPDDPNIGWKLHLNIAPEHAQNMVSYLGDNAYHFKYLGGPLGGNRVASGKVFTIYVGSYEKTVSTAMQLSDDLAEVLRYPDALGDIEFAPGVVGRFCAPLDTFTRTGTRGLVYNAYEYDRTRREETIDNPGMVEQLELSAIRELNDRYRQYFRG